jgi:predicted negative regulator of RcsB-dependent stress response
MNRSGIRVLFVLLVIVIAVGFYRGWFSFSSRSHDAENKVDVNLTVDRDKIQEDAESVKKKTSELTEKVTKQATPEDPK